MVEVTQRQPVTINLGENTAEAAAAAKRAEEAAEGIRDAGYENRWFDARFKALHRDNWVLGSTVSLDGKPRLFSTPGSMQWDMTLSPFGTPAPVCTGATTDIYHHLSDGPFRTGEKVRAKIGVVAATGSTFTATLFLRSAFNGSVLANTTAVTIPGSDSYAEFDLPAITLPSGATVLAVRLNRTAGTGSIAACHLQATSGTLARPVEEDRASGSDVQKARRAADAAADKAGEIDDLFTYSKNLFDPASPDVKEGHFVIWNSGAVGANASYNATGFVPVDSASQYTISYVHSRAFYDANKSFISGTNGGSATFTPPAGAKFARFTVLGGQWGTFQVEKGAAATAYAPYFKRLKEEYVTGDLPDRIGPDRLRQFHYLRRKRLLGEAAQIVIGLWGDSYTHLGIRWSTKFAEALIGLYGDAGGGWTGFGFTGGAAPPYVPGATATQPGSRNINVRGAYAAEFEGQWTSAYATVPSPDTCCAISSTAGAQIEALYPASPALSGVDLFWIGTADGVMEYSWDEANWTTINVQGTVDACHFASLAGVPASGAGRLYLRVVSGTCKPAGVNWKSAASGVVVHKLAGTGSRMQQLAAQADKASWRTAVGRLGVNTAIVTHGANDQASDRSPADFAANAVSVLNGLQSARPGCDRLLIAEPENLRGEDVPMKLYQAELANVARDQNVAFLNLQPSFGDADNPTDYGSTGPVPLMSADNLHPEADTGGRAILDAALRFMEV